MSEEQEENTEEPTEEEEHAHHDSMGTTHANYRWKGLATTLALALGIGYPVMIALHAFGTLDVSTVPQWAYLPLTGGWASVVVYTFGEDIKQAWKGQVE